MKFHLFPFSEQPVSTWSGGSTRQLAIYPFGTSLAARDFIFRISTATVEAETSSFSNFDGFQRVLMILEGELNLDHKGHYTKKLASFDTDKFDGSWETSAEGKVADFNVIYSDKIKNVEVNKSEWSKGCEHVFELADFVGIYVLSGSLKIVDKKLNAKDFVLIENEWAIEDFKLSVLGPCKYIMVSIVKK